MTVRTMVRSKVCYCQHASMLGVTASASTIYESYISPVSVICQSDISHIYFCDGSAQMRRRTCVFQQLDITFDQRKLCQTFCLGFCLVKYFVALYQKCWIFLSKVQQLFIKGNVAFHQGRLCQTGLSWGKPENTKTDEFSEKYQTAFDHLTSFSENHIADLWGHIDVCTFWFYYQIYSQCKGNLQYNFLHRK